MEEVVSKNSQLFAIVTLFLNCIPLLPQTTEVPNQTRATVPFVMSWKANTPGCDSKYFQGREMKAQFTSQASIIVSLLPESGKLAMLLSVANEEKGPGRLEVIPENVHLLKLTGKGFSELKRVDASKEAKSRERRVRIAQALGAGLSSFGSETTANGNATYSDGTTATYSATMPNPQAQADAVNRAQENIQKAHAEGAVSIGQELKRTSLDPGQSITGRVFFPRQKKGSNVLLWVDLGNARYEFPLEIPE